MGYNKYVYLILKMDNKKYTMWIRSTYTDVSSYNKNTKLGLGIVLVKRKCSYRLTILGNKYFCNHDWVMMRSYLESQGVKDK